MGKWEKSVALLLHSSTSKETFPFFRDMDFNLVNDFVKISSFNVDIPDLDVSSPVKKSASSDEKPKEVFTDGKTQGKSNRSTCHFDFNEYVPSWKMLISYLSEFSMMLFSTSFGVSLTYLGLTI